MKAVRFLAAARRELLAEVLRYSEIETGLGIKFAHAFEAALAIAVQFPLAGCQGPSATRKVLLSGFPFSIHYLEESEAILVIAVAHHARRPGYWIGRVGSP